MMMGTAKLPAAVIFDWDNTLIDTFPLLMEATNLVRTTMGFTPWDDAEARQNIRLAGKEAFKNLYGPRADEAERIFYDHIAANHLKSLSVMEGAAELLSGLQAMGVPMGILSNKRGRFLRAEVEALGWSPFFHTVFGPDDVGHIGKPKPDGLWAVMNAMGLKGHAIASVWYAGDTENDLRTAKAAGVVPVYIENHTMSHPDEIAALQPSFSFTGCRDCLDYLSVIVNSPSN